MIEATYSAHRKKVVPEEKSKGLAPYGKAAVRRNAQSLPKREGKSLTFTTGKVRAEEELNLIETKRICERCRKNEVYLDIKTMNLCENCIWESVQNQ